jgi:hypothetical protein
MWKIWGWGLPAVSLISSLISVFHGSSSSNLMDHQTKRTRWWAPAVRDLLGSRSHWPDDTAMAWRRMVGMSRCNGWWGSMISYNWNHVFCYVYNSKQRLFIVVFSLSYLWTIISIVWKIWCYDVLRLVLYIIIWLYRCLGWHDCCCYYHDHNYTIVFLIYDRQIQRCGLFIHKKGWSSQDLRILKNRACYDQREGNRTTTICIRGQTEIPCAKQQFAGKCISIYIHI